MAETPGRTDAADARKTGRGAGKGPVLRFVLVVVVLLVAFNAFFYGWFSNPLYSASSGFEGYLDLNARVTAWILRLFGEEASVTDLTVISPRFALGIKRGCDAIQPSVFYALFVAASPVAVSFRRRLAAIGVGVAALLFINLFRLVTLYYTGVYIPSIFEVMHVEVWQMAFIALPILFWLIWLRRQWPKPPLPQGEGRGEGGTQARSRASQ